MPNDRLHRLDQADAFSSPWTLRLRLKLLLWQAPTILNTHLATGKPLRARRSQERNHMMSHCSISRTDLGPLNPSVFPKSCWDDHVGVLDPPARRNIDGLPIQPEREWLGARIAVDELAHERAMRAERICNGARKSAEERPAG